VHAMVMPRLAPSCLWLILACASSPTEAQNVTVSGQSAGGSMAMQHLFAFSQHVQGAAIAAGSPYGCGAFQRGHVHHGATCYYGGTNVQKTISYVHAHSNKGLIDDPNNLSSTPVIVFNGKDDWEVYTAVGKEIVQQLKAFVKPTKLDVQLDSKASHVWSLDHGSCRCGQCAWWGKGLCCDVNNCKYDLSGEMFRHFYGTLKPRVEARQNFSWISQEQYLPPKTPSWSDARIEKWAVLYLPTGCRQKPAACYVHVHYHGCIANKWTKRRQWINHLDLNEYGEANDIIILYPQAKGDRLTGKGCWNWGFTKDDRLFDTRQSVQLKMVMNIVADLPEAIRSATELAKDSGPPTEHHGLEAEQLAFV